MTPSQFRRRSIRLPDYNYNRPGAYFITVCTRGGELLLGQIAGGAMHLSEAGRIAQACWGDLPRRYPDLALDVFVVMPNHLHGIVVITDGARPSGVGADRPGPLAVGAIMNCPYRREAPEGKPLPGMCSAAGCCCPRP